MMKQYLTARRLFLVWIILAFVLSWSGSGRAADAPEVRVALASNFIAPMQQLAKRFEADTGVRVVVSSGSTGKLFAQIKNGAPFDVFLAATAREPELLEAEGSGVQGTRFTYARGRLALWCPTARSSDAARACLDDPVNRLAIANPRLAPYGQAAQDVLSALGLRDAFSARTVSGENIAQAFQLVWSGNVPVGFVALSQVKDYKDLPGAYWVVPSELHEPIDQQAVLLSAASGNESATAFLAFLKTPAARIVMENFGYDVPQQTAEVP